MKIKDLPEPLCNKKNHRGLLIPLVQEYSTETTIGIVIPFTDEYLKLSEKFMETLIQLGYTRVYLFYLITEVGEYSDLLLQNLCGQLSPKTIEYLHMISPDLRGFYFVGKDFADPRFNEMIQKREEELKYISRQSNKDIEFGDLSKIYDFHDISNLFI